MLKAKALSVIALSLLLCQIDLISVSLDSLLSILYATRVFLKGQLTPGLHNTEEKRNPAKV